MEWKIGEIFEHNGEWCQCVPNKECNECAFHGDEDKCCMTECSIIDRSDSTSVVFMKLEKVGEPYEFYGHLFQPYRTFEVPIFTENYATVREFGNNSKISIEIKQNKEDMEEKKIQHYDCFFDREPSKSGLKPFSLEAAKAGKPVCTRDGKKARIICFDAKGNKPIIALINHGNDDERVSAYTIDGKYFYNSGDSDSDLMMSSEKKEGWINVYENRCYNTKEEAVENRDPYAYCMTTVKVSWEE